MKEPCTSAPSTPTRTSGSVYDWYVDRGQTELLADGSCLARVYPTPKARRHRRDGLEARVIEYVLNAQAALQHGTDPDRLSFTGARNAIQASLHTLCPGKTDVVVVLCVLAAAQLRGSHIYYDQPQYRQ